MEDFGIVYIIENAQQFWLGVSHAALCRCQQIYPFGRTELEDIIRIPEDASLGQLDAALARFVSFCATYHGPSYQHDFSAYAVLIAFWQNNTSRLLCS